MRAVTSRVLSASVSVGPDPDGSDAGGPDPAVPPADPTAARAEVVGRIDRPGLLALIGVTHTDDVGTARAMAAKLHELRILRGDVSCASSGAPLLVVSQFTLYARTDKGRRPSWDLAAPRDRAEPLVDEVVAELRRRGAEVRTGRFGAMMQVTSVNDGPFTVLLEV
ncbi:D-aminoacyl-tRNA deacylase [Nakamurella sp.]|uniref:D-aminoacyl-tRNA deacylase n=1 Tax=Nakamurella sp. TaxID=1869182 RepID=UPI003B3AA77D